MDNRKLRITAPQNGVVGIVHDRTVTEPSGVTQDHIAHTRNVEEATEIVTRWNAYPDLVAALEQLLDAGTVDLDQACKDARTLLATLNSPA